jgi:hypothetical protein
LLTRLLFPANNNNKTVLNRSGPGHAQTSSLFQANVIGNDFARSPLGKFPSDSLSYYPAT